LKRPDSKKLLKTNERKIAFISFRFLVFPFVELAPCLYRGAMTPLGLPVLGFTAIRRKGGKDRSAATAIPSQLPKG
jgi:hypothetical protein